MRIGRSLVLAALAAAHLAIVAVGPLIDAPPEPGGHQQHLAADTDGGCHPYHDDHCVVCRVLSTEGIRGVTPADCAPPARHRADALPAPRDAALRDAAAPGRARAPPA